MNADLIVEKIGPSPDRPRKILEWAVRTFGKNAADRTERAARLVEEAIELGQACGLSWQHLQRIATRTYSRPAGVVSVEIGQVGMTLEALAELAGLQVDREVEREFQRTQTLPQEYWNKRHAEKVAQGTVGASGKEA